MDRDEDVTVELPVVETDAPRERVYVPPRAVPPKTRASTVELQTVHVRQEPNSRQAPTVRLARVRKGSPPPQDVPTDRPGNVWRGRDVIQDTGSVSSGDAPTVRLPPASLDHTEEADVRSAATKPPDRRDAATLAPGELGTLDLVPVVHVRAREAVASVTPRPESRITDAELEAIQSARTLEVRQVPGPLSDPDSHRRGVSIALIAGGMLLGVLVVWAAVLVGRGSGRSLSVSNVGTVPVAAPSQPRPPTSAAAMPARSAVLVPIDVAPVPSATELPRATGFAEPPRPLRSTSTAPSPSASSQRSRAIY